MARSIVVAFRMSPAGALPGPEGTYLERARSLCARGEAAGGRLIAWGASLVALAYGEGAIEDAVLLATSVCEEAQSVDRAWSSAIAEGELEPLGPGAARVSLAWGRALVSAATLAGVALPGEVVIQADIAALREGRLSLLEPREARDGGERVGGWLLDMEHPWKRAAPSSPAGATREGPLLDRIRKLAGGDDAAGGPPVDALARLRRARARSEGGPPTARCQAALALSMMLSISGRPEDALLEALDALARAQEAQDPKAIGACMALLAKLYASAGLSHAATALRDGAGL